MPSLKVNEILRNAHKKYRSIPGKKNQQRADGSLRLFWVKLNKTRIDWFPKDWEKELEKKYIKNKGLSQLN